MQILDNRRLKQGAVNKTVCMIFTKDMLKQNKVKTFLCLIYFHLQYLSDPIQCQQEFGRKSNI